MQAEEPSNPFRFSIGCLLTAVTLIALTFGGCLALIRYAEGEDTIATFDCGDRRQIVVTAARSWEVSVPIYYFVKMNGEIVVPTTFIDAIAPDTDLHTLDFQLIASTDNNLFGLTYADDLDSYLAIHDFATGHSFPRGEHIDWNPQLDVDENREVRNADRDAMESQLNSTRVGTSTGG